MNLTAPPSTIYDNGYKAGHSDGMEAGFKLRDDGCFIDGFCAGWIIGSFIFIIIIMLV